ncbi:MAG TPA: translation initiation factor IF-2 subunit alpha [Methanocorpusculum sp.]|nr:translation initiation factor IF-2 subunit alpha [Methanocorpusculum sp.]
MSDKPWPIKGELVVCSVTEVKDFAAFVTLDEYEGHMGLIPIAEVAKGWIKYIRDHIREGQKVVCKVISVDESRGHIDLSLKDVNEHQRREKIQHWKNEQKANKWIGFVSKESGVDVKTIANYIYEEYSSLYDVFEDIAISGESVLDKLKIPNKVRSSLQKIAADNVKIPLVTVLATLELRSDNPDGVLEIRRALRAAESANSKLEDVSIDVLYLGAPKYQIKVVAPDYKTSEKALEKSSSAAIGVMKRAGGSGRLIRQK